MVLWVWSGVDVILLNQRLSASDSQPSVVIVHVLNYFNFFALEMKTGHVVELLDAAFRLIHFCIIQRNNYSEVDACS